MIFTKIKEIIKYPLIIVYVVFSITMLAGYLLGSDTEYSEMENRYLAVLPNISAGALSDGTFMEKFDTYTEEQIPLRDGLIKLKALCEMALYKCENNGIIRGDEGRLFEKTLSDSQQLTKNIELIGSFVNSLDREVYIAIAPTQVTVNAEYLPKGAPVLDEAEAQEMLLKRLNQEKNANIIDLEGDFEERSDRDDLYYKTDHHWNSNGAYVAYRKIAEKMGNSAVELEVLTRNQVDNFYGTSYSKYKGIGIKPDTIEYYDVNVDTYLCDDKVYHGLYDLDKRSVYDKYALFMYGNPGKGVIKSADCQNGRSLLIMKDSYANSVIPFLTQSYENITILDLRYFGGVISEELAANQDADVLLLYNWSFMNSDNHFYKLTK